MSRIFEEAVRQVGRAMNKRVRTLKTSFGTKCQEPNMRSLIGLRGAREGAKVPKKKSRNNRRSNGSYPPFRCRAVERCAFFAVRRCGPRRRAGARRESGRRLFPVSSAFSASSG